MVIAALRGAGAYCRWPFTLIPCRLGINAHAQAAWRHARMGTQARPRPGLMYKIELMDALHQMTIFFHMTHFC